MNWIVGVVMGAIVLPAVWVVVSLVVTARWLMDEIMGDEDDDDDDDGGR